MPIVEFFHTMKTQMQNFFCYDACTFQSMAALPQAVSSIAVPQNELAEETLHSIAPRINSATRIPALDGLRGVAILLVLLCHAVFEAIQPASKFFSRLIMAGRLTWSGVDLFFVLSGFLIGGILFDVKSSPRYFKTFYIRRAYRILPLYSILIGVFSLRYLTPHASSGALGGFANSLIPWLAYATLTQNCWMAAIGGLGAPSLSATWSLAVEEQFYLTVPFLIRKIERAQLARVLIGIVIAAPLLRTLINFGFAHGQTACFVLTLCRADALSLGVLSAALVRSERGWQYLLSHRSQLGWVTGILFVGLIPLTILDVRLNTPIVTVGFSWLAFFYTGTLLIAVSDASSTIHRILCTRMLMQLGTLAYATYLFHNPCMEICGRIFVRFGYTSAWQQHAAGFLGVAVALALAKLSWEIFEKPLLRFGHAYKY
jgi:peptidoglycan/LPS O-acetylase OafA/YrhL